MEEGKILCGANSYEQKYYFNPEFDALPDAVKKELQIMCVMFTEDVGGTLTLEFTAEGNLLLQVIQNDGDYLFDDIGAEYHIRQIQKDKKELLEQLEKYFRIVFLGEEE